MVFGRPKKDPVKEAQAREERLREELASIEQTRRELEERNADTPILETQQIDEKARTAKAEAETASTHPEHPKTEADKRLETLLKYYAEEYDGAFGELGPSGHASVERGLLIGILGELRQIRLIFAKK